MYKMIKCAFTLCLAFLCLMSGTAVYAVQESGQEAREEEAIAEEEAVSAHSGSSKVKEQQKIITLKPNTWTAVKRSDEIYDKDGWNLVEETYYRYRINVPSAGYLTLQVKDQSIYLYRKPNFDDSDSYICRLYNNGTAQIVVSKGSYYIEASNSQGSVKYSFKAVTPTKNYSLKRAITLKAGKKVTACISRDNYYSRWYKVKLTKKKAITFWSNYGDMVRIYDSKYNLVDVERAGTRSEKYFTKKLKKGTYYIRIRPYLNRVITLKWK